MINELQMFIEENPRILQRKQVQQIFLYMAFALRFCEKFKIPFNKCNDLVELLPRLFKNVSSYEIKEAAFALDTYMPWSVIQNNFVIHKRLNELFFDLYKSEKATVQWLLDITEEVLTDDVLTPKVIRQLIAKLSVKKNISQIMDFCSGTFLLGLEVWNELGKDDQIVCYGEDLNSYMCAISRLLLFLCDVKGFTIKEQDVIRRIHENTLNNLSKIIVADLPLVGNRTIPVPEKDRFLSENKRTLYADWMMMYKILQHLNDGDRAFLLVTNGTLVRENEFFLRKYFIDNDCVDTVITFPGSVYPNYNSPMNLLVFEKGRSLERKGKVLFIDLNQSENQSLSDGVIEQISQMFCKYSTEEKFARIVNYEEIVSSGYTLKPKIYLSDDVLRGRLCIGDVATVTRGLQDLSAHKHINSDERYLLNVRDIQNGEIIYETAELVKGGNPLWEEKFLIKEDDIIITAKGASLKIVIVPPNPMPAYISGNLMIIRVDATKYSSYVLYEYLSSEKGQIALGLIQTGTTIRVLGTKKMEQLAIPESEEAVLIGDGLKLATLQYRQALKDANAKLRSKKEELLSKLNKGKGEQNV